MSRRAALLLGLTCLVAVVPGAVSLAAEPDRIAGPSRFATSVAIAQRSFPDGADTVYLARGDAFADALAAGTLTDGPVLLVPSCGDAPPETAPEISRLNPDAVIALGGENAVCDDLLTTLADGRTTSRLAADDRFGTAAAIAGRSFPDGADVVYVAGAADSPDAVAGGALVDGPILLVPADGAPPEDVTATVERLNPDTVIALGGTSAVTDATLAATADGRPTDRLAGPSRFDTAAAIAARAFPHDSDVTTAYLARGDVFADAVASGSLTDGPVLLVGSCGPLPDAVVAYLTQAAVDTVVALGGTQAICDQALTDAAYLPDGGTPPPPTPVPQPTPDPEPTPDPDEPSADTELFYEFAGFKSYRFDTGRETTEFDQSLASGYTMTPDGSQFLWVDLDDVVNWHDIRSGERIDTTALPAEILTADVARAAPDGTRVSFRYDLDGRYPGSGLLAVVDRDGEDVLDADPDVLGSLSGVRDHVWSPRGELYAALLTPDDTPALVRIGIASGSVETIREFPTPEALPTQLAVSPDGTQMLYRYQEQVWRVDLDTGDQVQVTESGFEVGAPAFSPDGTQILFGIDVGLSSYLNLVPNGEYPEPIRVEPYREPEDAPPGAAFTPVADQDGRTVVTGDRSVNHWFPRR